MLACWLIAAAPPPSRGGMFKEDGELKSKK
jgi:hypothetical protein